MSEQIDTLRQARVQLIEERRNLATRIANNACTSAVQIGQQLVGV